MTAAVRLQLSRRKGFNLQALSLATNGLPAVNCARPGKLGNPFTIVAAIDVGFATQATAPQFVVACFRDWLDQFLPGRDWWQGPESEAKRDHILKSVAALRGKNLACWCKLGEPCHADVLLEFANAPIQPPDKKQREPHMTHSGGKPHNVGDRGQRYEIRMTGYPSDGENCLGWSDDLDVAEKMMTAILTAPSCTSATIFDRQEQRNLITRFAGILR